jgi:hypothetical protein
VLASCPCWWAAPRVPVQTLAMSFGALAQRERFTFQIWPFRWLSARPSGAQFVTTSCGTEVSRIQTGYGDVSTETLRDACLSC